MADSDTVDARGLSCPQPVMLTQQAINKAKKGTVSVLVDTNIAMENISRLAKNSGWDTTVEKEEGDDMRITLKK